MNKLSSEKEILEYINPFIEEEWRYSEEDINNKSDWDSDDFEIFDTFKCVFHEFEEGGRWSNYIIDVYSIGDKYFSICREVPATEMQDGMGDLTFEIQEVFPKEKIIVIYE